MKEKLTIIIPTFNKEDYIKDALDSMLSQKVDFKYKLIVVDDCSIDKTLDIIEGYKDKFDNMVILRSDKNNGLFYNIVRAYEILKSDYFCVLDPDDYYIDDNFLQTSIDFLEKNEDYTIYSVNVEILYRDIKKPYISQQYSFSSNFDDVLKNKYVAFSQTAGCVYRNVIFKSGLPKNVKKLQCITCKDTFRGDSFRNFIHLEKGKVYYDPKCRACYRITDTGIWQSSSKIKQDLLNCTFFKDMYFYFDKKYDELLYLSYERFLNIESNLLGLIGDDIKEQYIKQLIELKKIFNENLEVLNNVKKSRNNRIKMKDKIRLYLFNKLKSKLEKKRLL